MKRPSTESQIDKMSIKQMADLITSMQLKGVDQIKTVMKEFLKNKMREGKL